MARSCTRSAAVRRSPFTFDTESGRIAVCVANSVQVIAGSTGEIEFELPLGNLRQPLVAWRPGGEHLAVWGDAQGIVLWDVETRAKAFDLAHLGVPSELTFNADGSILVSASLWDRRMLAWDVATGQRFLDVPEFISQASDVGFEGSVLFVSLESGRARLSELAVGARRSLAQPMHPPLGLWEDLRESRKPHRCLFQRSRPGAMGLDHAATSVCATDRRLLSRVR